MESDICALCGRNAQNVISHLLELVENEKKEKIEKILNKKDVINFSDEIKKYMILYNAVKNIKKDYIKLKVSTVLDGEKIFTDIFEPINTIFEKLNKKYSKITEESTLEQLIEEFRNKKPVDKSIELINNIEKQYSLKLDQIKSVDRSSVLQKVQLGDSLNKSAFSQLFGSVIVTDYICITCRETVSKFGPIY